MLRQNKNAVYSFLTLVLAGVSYVFLGYFINADNSIFFNNALLGRFDWFIYSITNHSWEFASIGIISYLFLAVPFIFLICSVFFGVRALKTEEIVSSKFRMLGLVCTTISSFVFFTIVFTSMFLI